MSNPKERPDITAVYVWLFLFMESIDYFETYPSRRYLKDDMQSNKTEEEKVRCILQDDLVQRHLYKDWLTARYEIDKDPVQYFYDHVRIN